MRGQPGAQAEGGLVTVRLASGGILSPTGTEAVEGHPEEPELATRRAPRPKPAWSCPWASSEAPPAHFSSCSRCRLGMPVLRTTQNLWSCLW